MAGPATPQQRAFLALALPIAAIGLVACRLPSLRELDNAPSVAVDAGP
ncbi:hypothetical protein [Mycobacterium servetii]|uniref:Uncharacterized protein n=1 Tax=Mycobacterium servetii TaxID=3237418 RepID=A0ABV4BYT3_9MYCO